MDESARILGGIAKAIRWAWIPIAYVYGQWAVIEALAAKVPFHWAMVVGVAALAAVAWLVWSALALIDRYVSLRDGSREAAKIAQKYVDLHTVGRQEISIMEAAQIWMGPFDHLDLSSSTAFNVKLRQIKFGVEEGLLRCEGWEAGALPPQNAKCNTQDLAQFFREQRWLKVRGRPWPAKSTT